MSPQADGGGGHEGRNNRFSESTDQHNGNSIDDLWPSKQGKNYGKDLQRNSGAHQTEQQNQHLPTPGPQDLDAVQQRHVDYNLPPSFFQDDDDQGNRKPAQDFWPSSKGQAPTSQPKLKAFLGNRHKSQFM